MRNQTKRKQKTAPRKRAHPKAPTTRLRTGELLACAAVVVVFFWSVKTANRIVNYPQALYYAVLVSAGGAVGAWFWKRDVAAFRALDRDGVDRGLFVGLHLCKAAVLTWVATGIALLPFHYYNFYRAKEGPVVTDSVAIADVAIRGRGVTSSVSFWYKGRRNKLEGNEPLIDRIAANGNAGQYRLALNMNEGLLGSYVVNHWTIVPK